MRPCWCPWQVGHDRCAPVGVPQLVCPHRCAPAHGPQQVCPDGCSRAELRAEQVEPAGWAPWPPTPCSLCTHPPSSEATTNALPRALPPWGADPDPTRPPTSQLRGSQRERREEKDRRDLSCLGLTAERVIARPAWQFLIILSLFWALRGDSQCLAVCSERPRGAGRSGGSELPLLAVLFGARSDLSRGSR